MKAFIYEKYGQPETLRMAEVETPLPGGDEVLVKVLAASVNPADWHSMRGKPLFSRATLGWYGRNTRSSAATLPGRWRRSAAALPGSRPATRCTPISWTMVTADLHDTSGCQWTSCP
jgi:hypothetical protein